MKSVQFAGLLPTPVDQLMARELSQNKSGRNIFENHCLRDGVLRPIPKNQLRPAYRGSSDASPQRSPGIGCGNQHFMEEVIEQTRNHSMCSESFLVFERFLRLVGLCFPSAQYQLHSGSSEQAVWQLFADFCRRSELAFDQQINTEQFERRISRLLAQRREVSPAACHAPDLPSLHPVQFTSRGLFCIWIPPADANKGTCEHWPINPTPAGGAPAEPPAEVARRRGPPAAGPNP